jgi:hypothetical protein
MAAATDATSRRSEGREAEETSTSPSWKGKLRHIAVNPRPAAPTDGEKVEKRDNTTDEGRHNPGSNPHPDVVRAVGSCK